MDHGVDIAALGGHTMGTTWSVKLVTPRRRPLPPLHAAVQQVLDEVVAQMSTWEPGSDISRYNRLPAGQWQALPERFAEVLQASLQIARDSGGAFDPTVGPLVALWGFGAHAGPRQVPAPAVLAAVRARCGWRRLVWRPAQRQLQQPGGLELDLSGIAKGYAVDAVLRRLRQLEIDSALVEVGGELAGHGRKPDGQPWRVLLESAPEEDAGSGLPPRVLALEGLAVATSGDRWHRFELDGRRYGHTLDPRSGQPIEHDTAAVSVIAADATQADAWATALGVLGVGEGLALAQARDLAVRYLVRSAEGVQEHTSHAFSRHLEPQA